MSWPRIRQVLRKDLHLGPRSPLLLWAVAIPVLITLLVRGVFGDLFGELPRLGVVDEGGSELTVALKDRDGLDVRTLDDAGLLRTQVTDGTLDAGIVLPAGFDAAVRDHEQPVLQAWLSGESLPGTRAVLIATVLDLTRAMSGVDAPVDLEVVALGEDALPLDLRLLPLIVLYAVAIPGGMVPASSLVEEKEQGTLQAVLVTPTSVAEVLAAKGLLGVLLGTLAGVVTMWINGALGNAAPTLLLSLLLGAVMMALIGLVFGAWAADTTTLFAAWKAGGLVLFLPAIFFIWPGLPSWPAYLMPAYYFLRPAYQASVEGAGLAEVGWLLAIAAGLCLGLLGAVAVMGRWLQRRLAAGRSGNAGPKPVADPEPAEAAPEG